MAAGGGHFRDLHSFSVTVPLAISDWAPRVKQTEIAIMQKWLGLCIGIIIMQSLCKTIMQRLCKKWHLCQAMSLVSASELRYQRPTFAEGGDYWQQAWFKQALGHHSNGNAQCALGIYQARNLLENPCIENRRVIMLFPSINQFWHDTARRQHQVNHYQTYVEDCDTLQWCGLYCSWHADPKQCKWW